MSAIHKTVAPPPPRKRAKDAPTEPIQFLESDGEPLDSPWHRAQINLLIGPLEYRWDDRDDFYLGGNMFIYYTEEQARDIFKTLGQSSHFKGPDFFFINGVPRFPPRPYWVVWLEGNRYPNTIIELLSHTTEKTDRTTKKKLYERTFRTPEYFLFDFDIPQVEGLRLGPHGRYRRVRPNRRGWLWSEQLQLWLGTWHGTYVGITRVWLRFYDTDENLVLLPEEAEAHRANAEAHRANAEAHRADTAEAELARLKSRIAELESKA